MKGVGWRQLSWVVVVLAILVVIFAPEIRAESHRVVARIDEPFEVNGRLFAAGDELSLREVATYNPSLTLNEVRVGNECLGLLLAESSTDPSRADENAVLFERNPRGHLVLVGYAYSGTGIRELYQFRVEETGGRWLAPSHRASGGELGLALN